MDSLKGSRKILPAPVATAVLLYKASDTAPISFYPEHFEGDYVARELHCFVFPGNLADPSSAGKSTNVVQRQWEFHTFVLSGADNYRTYGHVLRFSYSNGGPIMVGSSSGTLKSPVHLDHAIVVLSQFAFFDALKKWMVPVVNDMVSTNPQRRMSVEPRICSLIHDALAIRSNYISSQFLVTSPPGARSNEPIACDFPVPGDTTVIPPLNFSLQTFFASVNPNIIVSIFELLLYAGHILFISSRVSLLTTAAQACTSLIWPLSWDFAIYIPVMPNQIGIEAVNFPNAAIAGMLRSHPDVPERLEDILQYNDALMIVDLDENRMIVGEGCRPNRLPPNIREKLVERLKLILSPNLVLCDAVDPDMLGDTSNMSLTRGLTTFGSPNLKLAPQEQVRVAFLLLLREICDGSFETKPFDEFKAAFLASPIYGLYQRNANENGILKQLIRMTEEKATQFLLNLVEEGNAGGIRSSSGGVGSGSNGGNGANSQQRDPTNKAFYCPSESWGPTEAPLVPNEAGISASGLNFSKSAFPGPNQRANELYNLAEAKYKAAVKANAPAPALADWILLMASFLLRLRRHHDCIRLLGKLEAEHPIFLCNDLMTLLMEALTAAELDTMSTRQSGDRLGDAARAFRETKSRAQPTTLSTESKELYQYIMTHEDTTSDNRLIELVIGRNVNVNATPQGISLLSTAVSMGKLRMAGVLLRYGATPDSDSAKNTIAHSLCSTKPRDEISYLLSIRILCLALASGLNINRGDSLQATPLSLLCSRPVPFLPLMCFFVRNGADTNALNVDDHPPSHFVIKTRMQQLTDISPVALLLDHGTNPMVSEPGAESFRSLVAAASDAITNNMQPAAVFLENNRYLTAKYAILRGVKSSAVPSKDRLPSASIIPPLPVVPGATSASSSTSSTSAASISSSSSGTTHVASSANPTSSAATTPLSPSSTINFLAHHAENTRADSAPSILPSGTITINAGAIAASGAAPINKPRAFPGSSDGSQASQASATIDKPAISLEKATPQKVAESFEQLALSNYAIVDAQYRQLVILTSVVHRYLPDIAKRKRKGAGFGFGKKRTSPYDAVLALLPSLANLLSHYTTLAVDIRHHTTMSGSRPSVAACFQAKMSLLSETQLEYTTAFYAGECRAQLETMNGEDMTSIVADETQAFASIFGSWSPADALLGNLLSELLDFPVRLSVLMEDLAKKSALTQASDVGKIQVLLTQLAQLRNRQDRIRHESQMSHVLEEVGPKLLGIAQFSFMMAAGTTLLKSGNIRQVRSIDAPGLSRVPQSELVPCRAYLFATSDETDNKGYLLLSCEGSVSERKRIPLKKAIVFDVPSFAFPHVSTLSSSSSSAYSNSSSSSSSGSQSLHSSLSASTSAAQSAPLSHHTAHGTPQTTDATLSYPIALVALHPSSTPHEYYLLECPTYEAKVQWLSLLYRICFEGRNWTHKRHLYDYVDRSPLPSEFEGWLDYSVDNEYSTAITTHYFSLRGNRLVATLGPAESMPIVIIFLDEYTLQVNDEPSLRHQLALEPAKHLAPRYLLHFGASPKILSKYPINSAYTDWRALLKHLIVTANPAPKM